MLGLLFLIIGLIGLWIGTEMVIKSAMNIADYYKLSHMFVGVTILAVGTDLPEMVIGIDAAIQKNLQGIETSGIIMGNAIGSSMSQITLILGIAGLVGTLTLVRKRLLADGLMILISVLLVFVLGFDGEISKKEGIVMIIVYLVYYIRLFQQEKVTGKVADKRVNVRLQLSILMLIGGGFLVVFASDIVVKNAIVFAEYLNVSNSFVGIIMIGLGTSLPELALSINAIRKKAFSLSVGNLIGSNIFDMLMPIGLGASIAGLKFDRNLIFIDVSILIFATLLALFFFYRKRGLNKIESFLLITLFLAYAIFKIISA